MRSAPVLAPRWGGGGVVVLPGALPRAPVPVPSSAFRCAMLSGVPVVAAGEPAGGEEDTYVEAARAGEEEPDEGTGGELDGEGE